MELWNELKKRPAVLIAIVFALGILIYLAYKSNSAQSASSNNTSSTSNQNPFYVAYVPIPGEEESTGGNIGPNPTPPPVSGQPIPGPPIIVNPGPPVRFPGPPPVPIPTPTPPPVNNPVPTPPPVQAQRFVTVQKWPAQLSTLWGIAQANHLSLAQVEHLNPQIKNPNLIYAGQQVRVQ